ncbi:MAG TPA: phage tail length tape measure family protein, partial [Azospirillum sp.]|nr:phage tail length tape measure family protein [Azospirillum sp.]
MNEEIGSLLVVMEASTALMRQQMAEGERAVERTTRGMTASLEKVNTLFGLMDKAATQSSKNVGAALARARRETDINAWGAELDKLQAKYDKTFAATKRFEAEIADLNRALKVGAISAEVYEEALADIERRSNPATVAMRQQAQALDQLRSKYDPVYAEVRRYGDEQARVTAILDKANVTDAERTRILRGVAEAYDPATRAAREHAQAAQAAADAQRRMVEQARATQNQGTAQHWYNTTLGVTPTGRSGSAAASAAVFQEAAEAAEKEAAALAKLDARARALREGIDPAVKAQRLHNEAIAEADELLDKGKISYAEHTAAVHRARDALHQSTGTQVAAQRATKLTAYELTNLSYQLQDVGVQLAAGTNPFLILAQQGPQATAAVGGVGRAMSLLLTPMGAAVLGVTAVAAALGTAFLTAEKYSNSIREVERVNRLTGGAVGLTTGALVEQSDALAGAAGLSRSSAREIQAAYVATGRIGSAALGDLLTVTKDWAALTGQDLDKAKEELGDFFASPARAAEELTRKLNLFSDA